MLRENLSNRSSRVQIPHDICTRLGCYLYCTRCSWIIRPVIQCFPLYLSFRDKKGNVFGSAYGELAVIRSFCKRGIMKNNYCKLMNLKMATVDHPEQLCLQIEYTKYTAKSNIIL